MKKLKNRFLLLAFLVSVFLQHTVAESQVNMTFEKNQYTIKYSINTTCSRELSLDILYNFSHLVKIVNQAEKIALLTQGDNWYIVQYDYNYILYKCRFVYKTTIFPDENSIYFEMVSFWQDSEFFPRPVRAYGRHTVVSGQGVTTIISTETCFFEKPVVALKQNLIKYESKTYIARLEKYLHKMENKK